MKTMKPSSADILLAIGKVAADSWPDPDSEPLWLCDAYDPDGRMMGPGAGRTIAEAMAMAWIAIWWDGFLEFGPEVEEVPFDILDGWTFKFKPPRRTRPKLYD